jgi:hypothetical protein
MKKKKEALRTLPSIPVEVKIPREFLITLF